MIVQETFTAYPVAANGTLNLAGFRCIGGFIADVSGTLTLTINGVTILSAVAVTAGVFLPLPFAVTGTSSIVLAGGAKGAVAAV